MKQAVRRARTIASYRVVLGGACASLLALGCGGGSESAGPTRSAAPNEPAPDDDGIDAVLPPDDGAAPPVIDEDEPPAPDREASEAPPVDEPEAARTCGSSVGFDQLYASIAADLRAEGGDGPFLRYVSLSNRLNQGICPEDLQSDRFALFKAVNSLSTELGIAVPEAIDADATLYRIDLRDLGWDRPTLVGGVEFADKWEAILAASPYAVEFEGGDADQAKLDANTAVPVLSADALIDAAMVDDVYYALIEVGASEAELLAQLGIDEDDVVLRAGTSRSRLSRQDMLVERFDQIGFQGYYWSRYDLAGATGGQSIFADPIGFQADSIAAVFSLPNGLNGYALFDGAGARVTDTDVIVDQTQRDGRVRNAVSCSQCHADGILPMADEVRGYVEANRFDFDADTLGEVQDTFLLQPELDDLIRQDSQLYRSALSRAGLDGVVGDPVSAVYVRFDGSVSLDAAAGELGLTPDVLDDELGFLAARVDGSLAGLRVQGLRREQFDALYLGALCALQAASDNRPVAVACEAAGQ